MNHTEYVEKFHQDIKEWYNWTKEISNLKEEEIQELLIDYLFQIFIKKLKRQKRIKINTFIIKDPLNFQYPSQIIDDKDRGLKTISEWYYFDTDETSNEKLVLTPFILSSIFENLIDRDKKHSTGTYYTPIETTAYIIKETLAYYFLDKVIPFNNDKKSFEKRIKAALDKPDVFFPLYKKEKEQIFELIMQVKILDPAVGAGIFLLFLVKYLADLIYIIKPISFNFSNFNAEYHIIKNCIFGIDIQKLPIIITRMRLFLSLLDKYSKRSDLVIPDLNKNIIVGNTLIDKIPITENQKYDIVIGNPPFIRQEKLKDLKLLLQEEFPNFYKGTADISTYFYKKGIDLLREEGFLSYISTNKFMKTIYGSKLRELLSSCTSMKLIVDLEGVKIFDANITTCIIITKKQKPIEDHEIKVIQFK